MNTVGPYHNRQETYGYFTLPFCKGPKESISHYHETLGEALQGTELELSGISIEFKANVDKTDYCQIELDDDKLKKFLYSVKNHYWYQMYMDDLPIWGIVGEESEGKKIRIKQLGLAIQRDGGTGLTMMSFVVFGRAIINEFMSKWHRAWHMLMCMHKCNETGISPSSSSSSITSLSIQRQLTPI